MLNRQRVLLRKAKKRGISLDELVLKRPYDLETLGVGES